MAGQDSLRIFLSWSGSYSREVALTLRRWLKELSDRVEPWVSDVDIESGARSMDELNSELDGTYFGMIVVTEQNQSAPWLNFEAGALSKQVQGSKARVVPLLMDMASPTELTGPISQYQAVLFKESGLRKLLASIAGGAGVDETMMMSRFDKFWPDLEHQISEIRDRHAQRGPGPSRRSERDLAEETLERIRAIERLLDTVPAPSTRPRMTGTGLLGMGKPPLDQVASLSALRKNLFEVGVSEVHLGAESVAIALPDDWNSEQELAVRDYLQRYPGLQVEWMTTRDFSRRFRRWDDE